MNYPGRSIEKGEKDKTIVKSIQHRLNELGCGPLLEDGDFGTKTSNAVKLFQIRFADQLGNPLKTDGKVGPLTWAALFGTETIVHTDTPPNQLLVKVLEIAKTQIGKMEVPPGSNTGPDVIKYQTAAGIGTGLPWCMAFVYWCFQEASQSLGRNNPLVKTGSVLYQWNNTTQKKIPVAAATANPALVKPGHIFIYSTGTTTGHTGLVEKVEGAILTTIEGNTNDGGSSEGIGVFRRSARKISSINKGFIYCS